MPRPSTLLASTGLSLSLASSALAQLTNLNQTAMSAQNVNITFASANQTDFATEIPLHTRIGLAQAASTYKLTKTYDATNFFSEFSFFADADPTHGYVDYQTYTEATSTGLAYITGANQVYMGVDWTTLNPPAGRRSVRVSSNAAYNHGLFIADIVHMPGNICGVWPAYWMFGPNWPGSGEVDIIEGVSLQGTDAITLHTSAGCSVDIDGSQAGADLANSDCNTDSGLTGCSASTTIGQAYGDAFNANGGGVYAMQWESSGVYVWFWDHNNIPADVTSGTPDTTNWGTPVVAFNGGSGCDVDAHFANMNIIFDTTFCGDWAGSTASWTGSGCSALAATCVDYVGNNPAAYATAFWLVNSIKVYELS